ncbi:MAG: ABC transporter permease, partial [Desulfurococcaceae archaeon]
MRVASATFIFDSIRLAFKAIRERKLRAILTMLGIMIGPLVMVMMGSVVAGYSNYIVNQISSLGQNVVIIYPESGYRLTQDDLNYIRSIEYLEEAEPFYVTQGIVKTGAKEVQAYVYAVKIPLILKSIGGIKIMEGAVPPEGDALGSLTGYKLAFDNQGNRQYRLNDVITITVREVEGGRITRIRNVNVVVSGVLEEYGGALIFSPDQTIFLNLESGRKLLGLKDWSGILVVLKDSAYLNSFTKELRDVYAGKLTIVAFGAIAEIASSITSAISFINFTTSLSALAVAIAGITATMVTSVVERTREIGVMKAVGFSNIKVVAMIISESLAMSIISG